MISPHKTILCRILKMISLFCRIQSLLQGSLANDLPSQVNTVRNVHPIAFEVSFHFILQSPSYWSLSNGTWQKRRRTLDHELRRSEFARYGVATISRLLKIIGLFGEYRSLWQVFFAKETYNSKEPTNRTNRHELRRCDVLRRRRTLDHELRRS